MYQKVKRYCKEHDIIGQGSRIVVGISGGPDSVCLLDMLCRMREQQSLEIIGVHVNHGLRGKEADQDEQFTIEICKKYQVAISCFHDQVAERAKREKISLEEAGRLCRYEHLEAVRLETKSDFIAVAHHANDQAETVLFHLVRGSGIEGLAGIRPVRGKIIRPLLCLTREEVITYLKERKLFYRIDSTNEDVFYTRNKIRHQWIPMLEEINPAAVQRIAKTASVAAAAADYISYQGEQIYGKLVLESIGTSDLQLQIAREQLKREHVFMQMEVLRMALAKITGSKEDLSAIHVEELRGLLMSETGHQISLPSKIIARNEYNWMILQKQRKEEIIEFNYELEGVGTYYIPELKAELRLKVLDLWDNQIILKDTYKKMFDYDKIKGRLHIRNRKSKDTLLLQEMGGRKSLRRYMIDEKIPQKERDRIPVLVDDQDVLWLIGYRIGAGYKIGVGTKKILLAEYVKM